MPRSRIALLAFVIVAGANLVAVGTGGGLPELATKPLLMPLLVAYLWLGARERGQRVDRWLLTALVFATGGDIALLGTGTAWFVTGMGLFLCTQLSYIVAFTRGRPRPARVAVLGYPLLTAATLVWLWPGLADAGLALPVAGYAAALVTMAVTASVHGRLVALGGALFLLSDGLIAAGVAGAGTIPGPPIWVMATYSSAQALIGYGWLRRPTTTG
jgi:uncharacterized membrane protein YhhN